MLAWRMVSVAKAGNHYLQQTLFAGAMAVIRSAVQGSRRTWLRAGHMAAPASPRKSSPNPCQPRAVHTWRKADINGAGQLKISKDLSAHYCPVRRTKGKPVSIRGRFSFWWVITDRPRFAGEGATRRRRPL
ncbi:hypothetical protein GGR19_002578 [Croceicoccus naphthovorans]|nr:hypothetical protein [Croceicoccus naphthovorans]